MIVGIDSECQDEFTALAGSAGDFYGAAVLLDHRFGVIESEAIALDIVDIAGGNAIEFVEDVLLLVRRYSDTVVQDTDFDSFIDSFCSDVDVDRFSGVFDGVVYEVTDDV